MPAEVGKKAPAFTLENEKGEKVSLKDFAGKKVVLYFYPKDMTPGCTVEAQGFRDAIKEFAKRKAAVLGVSADSVERHAKFRTKEKLPFPLLSDPEHKALEAYGVWKEKSLYGRKFMGISRETFLIDEGGKIAHHWPKVATKTHAKDVLAFLDGK
ncbi:MAG: thioredoxin-dependent thiol peroxidase [Candidatus Methylomirabilis sp.]|nr:thioredoxin-dependent thiol peroxidase [Deltaproteobacteria bacterium]